MNPYREIINPYKSRLKKNLIKTDSRIVLREWMWNKKHITMLQGEIRTN